MELRHLRTFLAVAEELHFGAAADRLYMSPPSVTEHIQALEREVGVVLFVRGRSVKLTEAGEVLVVHRLNFRDHLTALLEHRVDVAFVRPAPYDERVEAVRLSEERRVAVLPTGHAMADAVELSAEEVLDEPFVSLVEDVPTTFADYLHLRSLRGGLAPRTVDVGCSDVTDVLAAVSAGRGVASAVESFRGYENWPGVSYVTLAGAELSVNVLLSRRDDPWPLVTSFASTAKNLAWE